jgi:hypothetical protein
MNITEIDDALSTALHALSAAQAVLRKSLPGRSLDVLRKDALSEPRASAASDPKERALALLADAERRIERLEASRDLDAQTPRKTYRDTAN